MKKVFISIAVVAGAAGLIYVLTYKPSSTASTTPTTTQPGSSSSASTTSNVSYKDGTYTGATSENDYGPVQVSVVISGGKITDVTMLQTPSSHARSQEINAYATPILIKEAISGQTSNVDAVSGATSTSGSFVETMQSALDQAKS